MVYFDALIDMALNIWKLYGESVPKTVLNAIIDGAGYQGSITHSYGDCQVTLHCSQNSYDHIKYPYR